MGDNIRIMNTRVAALCFVAAVAVAVNGEGLDGVSPLKDVQSESAWAETTSFVQGFLSAKGNDETACAKIADTAIKAIEDECKALQVEIDKRAKDNAHCCDSGLTGISEAETAHEQSKGHHSKCLEEKKSVAQEKVDFGKISYESLDENTCKQTFFNSGVYQTQHKKVTAKKEECTKLDGIKQGLAKGVDDATYAACISRGKCAADAEGERDSSYQNGHKACGSQKNKDAFTRAHHIKCVLAGTSLQGCSVPTAPSVKQTAMTKLDCKLKCKLTNPVKGSTCNHGGHTGFRIFPHKCGNSNVGLQTDNDDKWVKSKTYHCPNGWYWPTADKYFYLLKQSGCHDNNSKSSSLGGAFSGQCGWSGYHPPKQGGGHKSVSKYFFIFKDSATNNGRYQHAGNYIGYQHNTGASDTGNFGGYACVKMVIKKECAFRAWEDSKD